MNLSSLTPTDKIKLAAELDGWKIDPRFMASEYARRGEHESTPYSQMQYLTSYDAIIPLIQKQTSQVRENIMSCLVTFLQDDCIEVFYNATPSQLLDALLVATGKATL